MWIPSKLGARDANPSANLAHVGGIKSFLIPCHRMASAKHESLKSGTVIGWDVLPSVGSGAD
jgi:hypothetical protein